MTKIIVIEGSTEATKVAQLLKSACSHIEFQTIRIHAQEIDLHEPAIALPLTNRETWRGRGKRRMPRR